MECIKSVAVHKKEALQIILLQPSKQRLTAAKLDFLPKK